MSSWWIDSLYAAQATLHSEYNTALAEFEPKRTTYNAAADAERARLTDFFKTITSRPFEIPSRPCAPTRPAAWASWELDYNRYFGTGAVAW